MKKLIVPVVLIVCSYFPAFSQNTSNPCRCTYSSGIEIPISLRIVTYNVGNFSKYMPDSDSCISMIANMLHEFGTGIVGLNECDSVNQRHNTNQVEDLSEAMGGWQWYFGRAMEWRGGAYGNGVLVPTGTTILDRYTVSLPKGNGNEPRSIAVVETDKYIVGAVHLDNSKPFAQVQYVNAWAEEKYTNCDKPVFLIGDMNAQPQTATIAALLESWNLLSGTEEATYTTRNPQKCLDYIFVYKMAAGVTLLGSGVLKQFESGDATMASDHFPVYVDVMLPLRSN